MQVFSSDSRQSLVQHGFQFKTKKSFLSIEDKLTVCDLIRKKFSYSEINNRFNTGKPTISDIVRGEEKFKKFKQSKCELKKTKTMRGGKFDKIRPSPVHLVPSDAGKGVPVTGTILSEKGNEYHALLHADSPKPFTASYGFQWRFCNRFGIRSLSICGENSLLT